MDITQKVEEYKKNAFDKKKLLFSFLENFSINDKITDSIMEIEEIDSDDYVYWVDGGLSWYRWYNKNLSFNIENFDTAMAMSICNLKFNYIFNNNDKCKAKIEKLLEITEELKNFLNGIGFVCKIERSTIDYKRADKTYLHNIKLILKESISKQSKMDTGGGSEEEINKSLNEIRKLRKQEIFNYKNDLDKFDDSYFDSIKDKTIVEFNVENYKSEFKIKTFKQFYINNNDLLDDTTTINKRYKLNILNDIGLLTFSIINNSRAETRIDETSGINIEALRQKQFIERFNNLEKTEFDAILASLKLIYENLEMQKSNLDKYSFETHKNQLIVPILKIIGKFYNIVFFNSGVFKFYFENNVKDISYQYSYNYYYKFIDFVDRYLVTLFRPVINSFIREINKELFEKHKIKLFVAGGDSMRRYDYDSSFSADIDTKLHIQNAKSKTSMTKKEIEKSIFNIVMRHIVNAQNYFETNKIIVLEQLVSQRNNGQNVFKCENNDFKIYVNILTENVNHYQFRTRKIDISVGMPVDLFSIDFKYFVKINENGREYVTERNVALLDVVISKDKDYNPEDLIEIDGVAYASQSFLLKDLTTTYETEKMALGRLSNGKVNKDIDRFKKMMDDTEISIDNKDVKNAVAKELNDLKEYNYNEKITELNEILISHERLSEIIEKLRNKKNYNKKDEFFMRNLNLNLINAIEGYLPNFGGLLKNIWKYDPIYYQIRDLRAHTDFNNEIKIFFDKMKQIPELDNLIIKIEEKEALDIHDFFTINDLCNNNFSKIISYQEFKERFTAEGNEHLVNLFEKILNFEINLPFEELNIYTDDYKKFSETNHLYNENEFKKNNYYKVFETLCSDTSTPKHSVSFSKTVVSGMLKSAHGLPQSFGKKTLPISYTPTTAASSIVSTTDAAKAAAEKAAKIKATREENARKAAAEKAAKAAEVKKVIEEQISARAQRASTRRGLPSTPEPKRQKTGLLTQ